jgi:signal transduction histidine kinase/ActR/RegA family two-component response regulator
MASVACSAVGALAGLIALIGWITANELLKGAFFAGITMKTNTALCLMLSGAFIGSLATGASEGPVRARWMKLCAWLVIGIGMATLAQHLFGVNLGIDQLLFEENAGAAATQSPNRMGPVGAICLILLGLSRLAIDVRTHSGRAPSQYLTLGVVLVASIPLLGFLFGARVLFGIGKYTAIALPTAVALWLLALGLLLARLDAGFMRRLVEDDSGAMMIRRLLPAAVFVPLLLMLLHMAGQKTGLLDQVLARALLVLAFMVVFTVLIWRTGEVVYDQATSATRAERELRERLVQSLEQLSTADQLKTDFLALLAHELRNPLAPVRNAVQLLRARGRADPEADRTYDVIERQVEHLARLIDDLMDVSRISRDRLELRTSRVLVSEVVARAIEGTRYLIDSHRHQLSVDMPADELELEADAARLVQVLINLLANASRYTPEGGQIRLSVKHEGEALELSVSDNGIGISAEQVPHVFDMFYQGGRGHRSGHHGLGIGLGLVKKLIELHGGSVSVGSGGAGEGSTFCVCIPGPLQVVNAKAPAPSPATMIPSFSGLSVLVVEDNEDSAEILGELLALTGARLQIARDGELALGLAAQFEPNIILLDIGLPGMSGYEVAARARQTTWGSRAFIIALTGWGSANDRARSRAAGFDRHLVKPVDPKELMALLAEARDHHSVHGVPSIHAAP